MLAANTVKDDATFISATFAMRFAGRAGSITADGANFFERAARFVETMLALDDQRVGESKMAVQNDHLVGLEFDNKIDDPLLPIDVEHGKDKMIEVAQFMPSEIAIIEGERGILRAG